MGRDGGTLLQKRRLCPPTASKVQVHPGSRHAWHLPEEPAAEVADGAALATDEPPRADDAEGDAGQLGCRASPSALRGAVGTGASRPRGVPDPLGPLCPRSPSSSHPHGQAPDGPPGARRAHSSELCRPPCMRATMHQAALPKPVCSCPTIARVGCAPRTPPRCLAAWRWSVSKATSPCYFTHHEINLLLHERPH